MIRVCAESMASKQTRASVVWLTVTTAAVLCVPAWGTISEESNTNTNTHRRACIASLTVDSSKPKFITNEMFFSLGMDVNLIRKKWVTFDFTSERTLTMARALGPAYLRFSGTDADRMIFNKTSQSPGLHGPLFPPSNFTMTPQDWDNINKFCLAVNWRLIFGLNEQLRQGDQWDPTNAMELLDYSIKQGYSKNLDFELGNEPDLYRYEKYEVAINGSRLAKDFQILHKILSSTKYKQNFGNSVLIGPDVGGVDEALLSEFVNGAGDIISAVTFHHYYGGSNIKYISNYTDPALMDTYKDRVNAIMKVVAKSKHPYLKIWQGETATGAGPPGTDIAMSYVAGFMLLDKLGLSAALGVDLVVRQTFYGFWFALVDQGLHSTPDYWISLLFKRLVGREVLKTDVTVTDQQVNPRAVRFYAHCTKRGGRYPDGAVVLYGMSLLENDVTLKLTRDYDVDQYLLTPGGWGGITSRFIALNGNILFMPKENSLPSLEPLALPAGHTIHLPAKALGFFILKDANASACRWPNL